MNAAENKTDILSHLGYNNQPRLSATVLRVDVKFRGEIGTSWRPRFLERDGTTLNLRYLSRLLLHRYTNTMHRNNRFARK